MNGIWGRYDLPPHAVHHGVMAKGNWGADYYTSQPDPSNWIAVGLVAPLDAGTPILRRMLVGVGCTEGEALNALWVRVSELSGDSQFTIFPEPSTHRAQTDMAEPRTCARVYFARGDRFTVPDAAIVQEDPESDALVFTDASGSPISMINTADVIGYLIATCEAEECF
ncbi:MAG: hypothetical protein EA415_00645 [Sphaerobacteraceae bacterium]|nr:MAG: hypothetical protein EA415_00645 [Sphaerobacteraceae bacterium]